MTVSVWIEGKESSRNLWEQDPGKLNSEHQIVSSKGKADHSFLGLLDLKYLVDLYLKMLDFFYLRGPECREFQVKISYFLDFLSSVDLLFKVVVNWNGCRLKRKSSALLCSNKYRNRPTYLKDMSQGKEENLHIMKGSEFVSINESIYLSMKLLSSNYSFEVIELYGIFRTLLCNIRWRFYWEITCNISKTCVCCCGQKISLRKKINCLDDYHWIDSIDKQFPTKYLYNPLPICIWSFMHTLLRR